MRLVTFELDGARRIGALQEDRVVPLDDVATDMLGLLNGADAALDAASTVLDRAANSILLSDVRLCAPICAPPQVLGIGRNYMRKPEDVRHRGKQVWFSNSPSSIVGHGEPIVVPASAPSVDYEGELAVVIGREAHDIRGEDEAHAVIAGFTVANDVTNHDWLSQSPTVMLAKSYTGNSPIGPWLVTRDEIPDPYALRIRTWVNDELRQDGTTADMLNRITQQIEHLTEHLTLMPGDVIMTGTPAGTGNRMDPPRFLVPGDVVRIEIEGIGVLENPVVAGRKR
ncbi:fumarylacetoacetate hydrolase family protein [Rhodococcus sp. WS3]|nr:fumarylacetoacetate hydrolase family protein [Rhodococcus sp. WS3]